MKIFSKASQERTEVEMRKCIPYIKEIKFFSQREIEDEEYLEISKFIFYIQILDGLLN